MNSLSKVLFVLMVASLVADSLCAQNSETSAGPAHRWAQWRGPVGTGEAAANADPPTRWSESENIKWKTPVSGLGHSTPVVWDDHIFLTSALPVGEKFEPIADGRPGSHDNLKVSQRHRYLVTAVDRESGKVLWEKAVNENVPHEGGHDSSSLAAASLVTDGAHVYAYFGSHGLFCLDFEGNVVWDRKFEPMHSKHGHGEGSSPALANGLIAINRDQEAQSYLLVLDAKTGEEKWRSDRAEVTSWSSPAFIKQDGTTQLVVAGTNRVRGYDPQSGEVIWECGGLSNNVVATPLYADGMLYCASSYEIRSLLAIKLDGAKGDITGSENVVWQTAERTPYVPSPLLYQGNLFFLRHYQGILSVLDAKTGEETAGPFRMQGFNEIYASPMAAANRVYIVCRSGATLVIDSTALPKVLGMNLLDDSFSASPIAVGNQLLLRGEKFLYCIE
ncbi:outer membrane protein assembly factor BamB family protein [Mariniblastus fucicola]|uniref:Outer membrane biogenesis protein BamB n=1 Tax=Mariniblastus fucicola TaxID=980251 RepID=A0A5B9PDQ7_9BACT|nr:PQQ-binding-like beta-propeller repeat protein [Mariniblastus fucicola]QEG24538.1 outer membrane biogenesis protein BamB [Mariniblastus fucicola]